MGLRREDARYAAATAAALALVGYLVASNFGLVPSPFVAGAAPAPPRVALPPVAAPPPQTAAAPGGGIDALLRPGGLSAPDGRTAPPVTRDTVAPRSTITGPDGPLTLGLDGGGAPVTGTTTDDRSGVSRVVVTFERTVTDATTREAELSCDPTRRSCTWEAEPPAVAGSYTVRVQATDAEGNVERPGPAPRTVTVVTSTPEPEGSSDGLVPSLVGTLRGVLGI